MQHKELKINLICHNIKEFNKGIMKTALKTKSIDLNLLHEEFLEEYIKSLFNSYNISLNKEYLKTISKKCNIFINLNKFNFSNSISPNP